MSLQHGDASSLASLVRLIHPVAAASFQDRHWSRLPLQVRRNTPGYFADLLSLRDVDRILAYAVTNDGIELVRDGRKTSLQRDAGEVRSSLSEYFRHYAEGQTIEIQDLHLRWTAVAHFANALSRELGFAVSVDAWVAPPHSNGLRCSSGERAGERDAFVLQLEGTTQWQLTAPAAVDGAGSSADLPAEILLAGGDTLYLPRGTVYEARTADQHALCLIIHVQVKTWADLLIKGVEVLSEKELRLRRALGFGTLAPADTARALSGEWQELMALVCDKFQLDDARVKLSAEHKERLQPLPDGHFTQLQYIDRIGPDTVVETRAGMASEMRFSYNEVELLFPGGHQHGPEKMFLAFDFFKSSTRFRVRDIPGWYSDKEKLLVVRHLMRKGYLRLVDPTAPDSLLPSGPEDGPEGGPEGSPDTHS